MASGGVASVADPIDFLQYSEAELEAFETYFKAQNLFGIPRAGEIDYTKATWTKATWTKATWTKATWTCVCATSAADSLDPTRATWTKASWTTDWTK